MNVLLVSRDLNARARVEGALGTDLELTAVSSLNHVPAGVKLVLLDLDAGGRELVDRVADLGAAEPGIRWIGFFAHIDEELGGLAREAGIEAVPRGRFWRELPDLLAGS
ncbi:MAG: hypothetical protein QOK47_104 [Actinomycetota bacterium]|nr:hypothetical protein [Actinomycetota bacterium]